MKSRNYYHWECIFKKIPKHLVGKKIMPYPESRRILLDSIVSNMHSNASWDNAAIFTYNVQVRGVFQRKAYYLLAIDLKDVCNRVDFIRVIECLMYCGINIRLVNLMEATLMQRRVACRQGICSSEPLHWCSGLPQLSPLSPALLSTNTAKLDRI